MRVSQSGAIVTLSALLQAYQYLCKMSRLRSRSKLTTCLDVNRHPLAICDFHRMVEQMFASSSFSRHVSADGVRLTDPC